MRILVINPGSTSTKTAVYEGEDLIFNRTIRYSLEELSPYPHITDQFQFRKTGILQMLKEADISLEFQVIIGRGGLLKPIPGGVYEVNEKMIRDLRNAPREHASNLGGLIAQELADEIPGSRAFIADPVVVDELCDEARITGVPELPRLSIFHALNHKAIARRYARENNTTYEELRLIVVHLGGGISVGAHRNGRVIDVNNALDGEGPFSPERSGTLPSAQLVELCFSGKYTERELKRLITGNGGLAAHLGTNDVQEVIRQANDGHSASRLVMEAMLYQTVKSIGGAAAVLEGKIDAILLTGGMAFSDYVTRYISKKVSFLAPVKVYPGEDEMEALALNALAAMKGELPVLVY